jgi:hypothetical protein
MGHQKLPSGLLSLLRKSKFKSFFHQGRDFGRFLWCPSLSHRLIVTMNITPSKKIRFLIPLAKRLSFTVGNFSQERFLFESKLSE